MEVARKTALVIFAHSPATTTKALGFGLAKDRAIQAAALFQTLRLTASGLDADRLLFTDGPIEHSAALDGLRLVPQRGTDFESRLLAALLDAAAMGYQRLVVIGGDTPGLERRDLVRALSGSPGEVVVGPSLDGGFYLLALDAADLPLLAGLPWCRPGLLMGLLGRFCGRSVSFLTPHRDIDRRQDALAERAQLERIARQVLGRRLRMEERPPRQLHSRDARAPFQRCLLASAPSRAPP